jgi:hypothetical protein
MDIDRTLMVHQDGPMPTAGVSSGMPMGPMHTGLARVIGAEAVSRKSTGHGCRLPSEVCLHSAR